MPVTSQSEAQCWWVSGRMPAWPSLQRTEAFGQVAARRKLAVPNML